MKRQKLDLRAEAYSDAADALYLISSDCGNDEKRNEYEFVAKKLDNIATKLFNTEEK